MSEAELDYKKSEVRLFLLCLHKGKFDATKVHDRGDN